MAELKNKLVTLGALDYFNRNVAQPHQSSITMTVEALMLLKAWTENALDLLEKKTDHAVEGGIKNILPSNVVNKNLNNVYITVQEDLSITVNGKLNVTSAKEDPITSSLYLEAGDYVLSKGVQGASTPAMKIYEGDTLIVTVEPEESYKKFSIATPRTVNCRLRYEVNITYDTTIYPMLMEDGIYNNYNYIPYADSNPVLTKRVTEIERSMSQVSNPFMLWDFSEQLTGAKLLPVTDTTLSTNLATGRITITLPADMQTDWKIAALTKYEVKNGNNRVGAFLEYSFSMSSQTVLQCGFKTTGNTAQTVTFISGALLLARRE